LNSLSLKFSAFARDSGYSILIFLFNVPHFYKDNNNTDKSQQNLIYS
jgi:hypothetical protein